MTTNDSACRQPASQAMTEQTARYYQAYTKGQLVAFHHDDGNWYLTTPQPALVPASGQPLRRPVPPRQGVAP